MKPRLAIIPATVLAVKAIIATTATADDGTEAGRQDATIHAWQTEETKNTASSIAFNIHTRPFGKERTINLTVSQSRPTLPASKLGDQTITLPAWHLSATHVISLKDNILASGRSTITVRIRPGIDYTVGSPSNAHVIVKTY